MGSFVWKFGICNSPWKFRNFPHSSRFTDALNKSVPYIYWFLTSDISNIYHWQLSENLNQSCPQEIFVFHSLTKYIPSWLLGNIWSCKLHSSGVNKYMRTNIYFIFSKGHEIRLCDIISAQHCSMEVWAGGCSNIFFSYCQAQPKLKLSSS